MFERVMGQKSAKQILQGAIENDSLSHAYLFSGPKGVGKTTMAIELAMVLNCEANIGCGQCSSCRRIKQGVYPDVKLIAPEGPSIKIGEIRELSNFIAMSSYEAKYKIGIITEAEKMRDEAANSLLKTLEEPPVDSVIILTAQNQYAVLPTILSRVQKVSFHRLGTQDIVNFLMEYHNETEEMASRLAEFSGGSLGKALELKDSSDMQDLFNMATKVVEKLNSLKPHEIIELCNIVGKDRQRTIRFLDLLSDTLRVNSLKKDFSVVFGKQYSITQIADILRYIEELKLYIEGYGNAQLALEGLFIRICRL